MKKPVQKKFTSAWVITADMGYGHRRAAYPLQDIAYGHIIVSNSDKLVSEKDRIWWHRFRRFYEWVSKLSKIPLLGKVIFRIYDVAQSIEPLYPYRNLSFSTYPVWFLNRMIRRGFSNSLIDYTKKKRIPIISTFYVNAISADMLGISPVYCVVTDVDINRVWVSKDPAKSNIIYLVPTEHTSKRLESYGVLAQNIIMTGFPLPKQNLGGKSLRILKKDIANRLVNLDPKKQYLTDFTKGDMRLFGGKKTHIFTLTFVIGGAGAQVDIGFKILNSLQNAIKDKKIRLIMCVGTHLDIAELYKKHATTLGLKSFFDSNLLIKVSLSINEYFDDFSNILRTTDVLWTKPSELSFYTALGIPIICAPPLGAHEKYNLEWLLKIGSGFIMDDPSATHEWLFDWLGRGYLAKAAFDGFALAPKLGTYKIEAVVLGKMRK